MKKLIQQGAEAKIFLYNSIIEKQRLPKTYRHPQLDTRIRNRRTKSETKILIKAHEAKINVPNLLHSEKNTIQMEYINGDRLSETLNSYSKKKQFEVMKKIGEQLSKLHRQNIIHADLTTSNTILQKNKVFIIDFGLSYISTKIENKAVDIHLIKQAINAKHFQNSQNLFDAFKEGYKSDHSKDVLSRLNIVEKRGRYKHQNLKIQLS